MLLYKFVNMKIKPQSWTRPERLNLSLALSHSNNIAFPRVPKAHQKHFIAFITSSSPQRMLPHTPVLDSCINKSANELENSMTSPIVCWQCCGTPEHLFQFTPQHCQEALQGPWGSLLWCCRRSWLNAYFLWESCSKGRVMMG